MNKVNVWIKTHKPHVVAISIIIIAAIAFSIAVAQGAFHSKNKVTAKKEETVDVTINITADHSWDHNSTPAILHITGTHNVDFYHAVTPDAKGNKGTSRVELANGDYTVSFIAPVNSDGSTYSINNADTPVVITVDPDAQSSPVINCSMTLIPVSQTSDEMLQNIVKQTRDAINNGDKTLKGKTGTHILNKLKSNIAVNPNASVETKQEANDAEKEANVNNTPAATTPSTTSDNEKNSSQSHSDSQSSNSGQSESSNQTSKPTHTHTWVNHQATRQVWVSQWVDVPDYSTQKTPIGTRFIFSYDGYSTTDINDAKAHAVQLIRQGVPDNYRTETIYETQTIQTGSHKEDHGTYKTETYVDYVYCSSCGARK